MCQFSSEGPNVENRWKWNETIGDLTSRPGHQGEFPSFSRAIEETNHLTIL